MTGLIGWWPLHETNGNKARDLSGNRNHGSLNGGVTQGVAGKAGLTAYGFDGSDDGISNSNTISGIGINEDCSWSFWFYSRSQHNGTLMTYKNGSSDRIYAGTNGDGTLSVGYYDGSHTSTYGSYSTGSWHHVVGTLNSTSGNITLYIDGVNIDEGSSSVGSRRETGIYIGMKKNGENPFNGLICDLRLYSRTLSPQEAQTLYRQGSRDYANPSLSDGSDPGAVSRWKFDLNADDSWRKSWKCEWSILQFYWRYKRKRIIQLQRR